MPFGEVIPPSGVYLKYKSSSDFSVYSDYCNNHPPPTIPCPTIRLDVFSKTYTSSWSLAQNSSVTPHCFTKWSTTPAPHICAVLSTRFNPTHPVHYGPCIWWQELIYLLVLLFINICSPSYSIISCDSFISNKRQWACSLDHIIPSSGSPRASPYKRYSRNTLEWDELKSSLAQWQLNFSPQNIQKQCNSS